MTYTNLWIFSDCYGSGSDRGDPLNGSLAGMPGQPSTKWRTDLQRVTVRMYSRGTTLWSPFLKGAEERRGGSWERSATFGRV
jgi:hypothetical protein